MLRTSAQRARGSAPGDVSEAAGVAVTDASVTPEPPGATPEPLAHRDRSTPPPVRRRRGQRRSPWTLAAPGLLAAATLAGLLAALTGSGPAPTDPRVQAFAGRQYETVAALARVRILRTGGTERLTVQTRGLTPPVDGGSYELWLFNSTADARRLGPLRPDRPTSSQPLPADASRYRSIHVTFQTGDVAGGARVLALSGPTPARGGTSTLTVPDPTWSDEFSGRLDPRRWNILTGGGGHGNRDLEDYTRGSVRVSGGALRLTARRSGAAITSGLVDSLGRMSARYGLVEASIRVPPGAGLWPTFWLEGTDLSRVGWPASGEIDAMEILNSRDAAVNGSVHTASRDGSNPFERIHPYDCSCDLTRGFHTYGIDWSPGRIEFLLDGLVYASETRAEVEAQGGRWTFDRPFFLLLSLAVGGKGDGDPTPATPFPATMSVNWVRVYANE